MPVAKPSSALSTSSCCCCDSGKPALGLLAPGLEPVQQRQRVRVERGQLELDRPQLGLAALAVALAPLRAGRTGLLGRVVPDAQRALEVVHLARELDDPLHGLVDLGADGRQRGACAARLGGPLGPLLAAAGDAGLAAGAAGAQLGLLLGRLGGLERGRQRRARLLERGRALAGGDQRRLALAEGGIAARCEGRAALARQARQPPPQAPPLERALAPAVVARAEAAQAARA